MRFSEKIVFRSRFLKENQRKMAFLKKSLRNYKGKFPEKTFHGSISSKLQGPPNFSRSFQKCEPFWLQKSVSKVQDRQTDGQQHTKNQPRVANILCACEKVECGVVHKNTYLVPMRPIMPTKMTHTAFTCIRTTPECYLRIANGSYP